jgi:hypothetical protein
MVLGDSGRAVTVRHERDGRHVWGAHNTSGPEASLGNPLPAIFEGETPSASAAGSASAGQRSSCHGQDLNLKFKFNITGAFNYKVHQFSSLCSVHNYRFCK